MTEVIYRVGDILEIPGNVVLPRQFGMFPKEETCRCLVLNVLHPGFDSISYTFLTHKDGFGTFNIVGVGHANIADCAKLISHCDISALRYEKPEEGSGGTDLLMLFTVGTIAQVADLRDENKKLKAELTEETLKRKQVEAELNEKAEELDGVYHSDIVCENNKLRDENEVFKRENEELMGYNKKLEQAFLKSEEKAHSRLDKITFLMRKVDELENVRDKLKAERDEAIHEIDRLIAENEKLRAANASFLQKIKCAEEYFDSAALALHEGREHLAIAQNSIGNK